MKNAAALLFVGLLAGCTAAGPRPSDSPVGATRTGSISAPQATGVSATATRTTSLPTPPVLSAEPNAAQVEYRIGPQDLLDISVFQVPDLSKTVKVNASGQISMALIGVVQAGGKTVSELEDEIASKLNAKYLQSAQVSVFVKEANSQQVTVDGAVEKPGKVTLDGQTHALADDRHFRRACERCEPARHCCLQNHRPKEAGGEIRSHRDTGRDGRRPGPLWRRHRGRG